MNWSKAVLVVALGVLGGCGDDDPRCGAGTVERGGECVAADGDADADADGDGDADADADGDGDGDTDGDADGDADCPDQDGDDHHDAPCGGDDCDDDDGTIYPGAQDPLGDCVDANCDGIDSDDEDLDGFASLVCGGDDCDDRNAGRHAGADDHVGDAVDQDCDGADGVDRDQDGYASVESGGDDCDDANAQAFPGQPDQVGDEVDENCDGVDGFDGDGDGYASVESGGTDCDDEDAGTHPGAIDPAGDGIDQACDDFSDCELVGEEPGCDVDGLDDEPAALEPGCGVGNVLVTAEFVRADPDAGRLNPIIAEPTVRIALTVDNPITYPDANDFVVLVNGCEVPIDADGGFAWSLVGDAMTIMPAGGTYLVVEVRDRHDPPRLLYRDALVMPSVLPAIETPAEHDALPAPGPDVTVPVRWIPFDVAEAGWADTADTSLDAFIVGGGQNQVFEDPNGLDGLDGTAGTATFSAGAFDDWDWLRLRTVLVGRGGGTTVTLTAVREVN